MRATFRLAAAALASAIPLLGAQASAPAAAQPARDDGAYGCAAAAHDQTLLEPGEIAALCTGSEGTAPVACFLAAQSSTMLSHARAIELCRCAISIAPLDCYRRLREGSFGDDASRVARCRPPMAHAYDGELQCPGPPPAY